MKINFKKEYWLVISLAILIIVLLGVLAFVPGKKSAQNQNQNQQNQNQQVNLQKGDGIEIFSPLANTEISSPLKIIGKVSGSGWTGFEATVGTVQLKDYKGNVLGQTFLSATTEWTKLPTNFEGDLDFVANNDGPGILVFKNENASGLPEHDRTFVLPVKIKQHESQTTSIKLYFNNVKMASDYDCSKVFAVERQIPKTQAVAKASLEELFKGPTESEKSAGFSVSITPEVKINSIRIENGTAYADFNNRLQEGIGGSCMVSAIKAQITQTLKQFDTVKNVVISIDGRTEDILQP